MEIGGSVIYVATEAIYNFYTIFMVRTVNHVYPKNEAENRNRILERPVG